MNIANLSLTKFKKLYDHIGKVGSQIDDVTLLTFTLNQLQCFDTVRPSRKDLTNLLNNFSSCKQIFKVKYKHRIGPEHFCFSYFFSKLKFRCYAKVIGQSMPNFTSFEHTLAKMTHTIRSRQSHGRSQQKKTTQICNIHQPLHMVKRIQ